MDRIANLVVRLNTADLHNEGGGSNLNNCYGNIYRRDGDHITPLGK